MSPLRPSLLWAAPARRRNARITRAMRRAAHLSMRRRQMQCQTRQTRRRWSLAWRRTMTSSPNLREHARASATDSCLVSLRHDPGPVRISATAGCATRSSASLATKARRMPPRPPTRKSLAEPAWARARPAPSHPNATLSASKPPSIGLGHRGTPPIRLRTATDATAANTNVVNKRVDNGIVDAHVASNSSHWRPPR